MEIGGKHGKKAVGRTTRGPRHGAGKLGRETGNKQRSNGEKKEAKEATRSNGPKEKGIAIGYTRCGNQAKLAWDNTRHRRGKRKRYKAGK